MFCKHCGKEIDNESVFCSSCGKKVQEETHGEIVEQGPVGKASSDVLVEESETDKQNTDEKKEGKSFNVLEYIEKIKNSKFMKYTSTKAKVICTKVKNSNVMKEIKSNIVRDKNFYIEVLKYTGIALLVALVISSAIAFPLFSNFNKAAGEMSNGIKENVPNAVARLKANPIDVLNSSLLSKFIIKYKGTFGLEEMDSIKIYLRFPIVILLLIPIISYLIAGFKKFKNDKSTLDNIKLYLFSSALFSLMVAILSLFSMKKVALKNSMLININLSITGRFASLTNIILAFVIILLIQVILSMVFKKEGLSDLIKQYPDRISIVSHFRKVLKYGFIYSAGFSILLYILMLISVSQEQSQALRPLQTLLLIPNMIVYIFLFMFGNPIKLAFGTEGLKIGWFKTSATGYLFSNFSSFEFILVGITLVLSMGVIVYIVIRKLPKENYIKNVTIFAGITAIFNSFISFFTRFVIEIKGTAGSLEELTNMVLGSSLPMIKQESIFIGVSFIQSFFVTLVFIALVGLFRYFLWDNKHLLKLEKLIGEKKKIVMLLIPIVIIIITLINFAIVSNREVVSASNDDSSYISSDIYDIKKYVTTREIFAIRYFGKNKFLLQTPNNLLYFDVAKRQLKPFYEPTGHTQSITMTNGQRKIAVQEYSKDNITIRILNQKGEVMYEYQTNQWLRNISWSPNGKYLLCEGEDFHKLLDIDKKQEETLEVPGYNLRWKDNENIVYIEDNEVFEFNIPDKKATSLNKRATNVIKTENNIYTSEKNEDGTKYIVSNLYDESEIYELENYITAIVMPKSKEWNIHIILDSEDINYLVQKKSDHGNEAYSVIEVPIERLYDVNFDEGTILLKRKGSNDIFSYNLNNGEWNNITLDLIYLIESMEEGDL